MDKVVPFARSRRRPDPARVAEFADAARKLRHEREVYGEAVRRAMRETPREQWRAIPMLATNGGLEQLSREVEARLDSAPREALAIAELATEVAAAVSAYHPIVVAQLRAQAWRDRGQALTYLSRYEEALRALDRAEQELEPFGTVAHDVAVVHFVRATALQHLRRFDEAQELLDECREVFRIHGDTRLYSMCTLAAGNLLVRQGDYHGAHDVFAPLAGDSTERDAIMQIALGWCGIHLDDPHDALIRFEKAESLFLRFNRELSALRASYGIGSALLRLGNLDLAINQLASARDRFLGHNLIEEAGLSGLELVEAHLLQHDISRAKTLSATIFREFTEAGLNRRAIGALAYLNEAIAASNATPEIVRSVHSFIFALRTDPAREFVVN